MKGNVYTRQKCWICEGQLVHNERRSGCYCQEHPKVSATRLFYVKFGRDINRRFKTYISAVRFLNGVRFKYDEGTYDVRDYQASNPLGFENLARDYLKYKKRFKLKTINNIRNYMKRAIEYFGNRNVKTIKKADIRKFLYGIEKISNKTRANHKSTLHDFFVNYLVDETETLTILDVPKFPEVHYELKERTITDVATLTAILDEVYRLTYHINPKVWLGIDMLATYGHLRPDDLRRIKERDINIKAGYITIEKPTKRRQSPSKRKLIRLLDDHIDIIKELKREFKALPHMPFFRHVDGISGCKADKPFGEKYFYKNWVKACENLGVKGLDLYGGTRHTMTTAIAQAEGTDAAREFNQNVTNKAFDRYCQAQTDRAYKMAATARKLRGDKVVNLKTKSNQSAPPPHHQKGAPDND